MSDLGFHAGGGLYFKRLEDGSVQVVSVILGGTILQEVERWTLSADTWASAVASVTSTGDTSHQFQMARAFHDS